MKSVWTLLGLIVYLLHPGLGFAQTTDSTAINRTQADMDYIEEIEDSCEPDKVLHAEPLYIDLIRDLGARKGEREWNVGLGLTDRLNYDSYQALVEYEWAPIDRLGLEVEVPFTFYTRNGKDQNGSLPSNRVESLKTAFQYSFFVSEKLKTTMAFGYINEIEFSEFNQLRLFSLLRGNVYNPFFIIAKRWRDNYHTLIYTGPRFEQHFKTRDWHLAYEINSNFHYMITGTRNFIGIELNKQVASGQFDMVMRPQMRLGLANHLLVGIVAGIPVNRSNERLSSFIRLIYEPSH
jgi:hypothetical protein